ncbi:MAG: LuxR C-terminal-related transcriptional regulator [Microbacterium sp.]
MANQRDVDADLRGVVEQIEAAFRADDLEKVVALIGRNTTLAWVGIDPDRSRAIFRAIAAKGIPLVDHAPLIPFLLSAHDGSGTATMAKAFVNPEMLPTLRRLATMLSLVTRGQTAELPDALDAVDRDLADVTNVTYHDDDLRMIALLESGLAAVQLGDFARGLGLYTLAQLQVTSPTLVPLTRLAYLRAALVHCCFGDPADGLRALDRANELPRLSSWLEIEATADEAIVRAATSLEDFASAREQLDAIPMHTLGPSWPFYIVTLRRVLLRMGDPAEFVKRLTLLEQLRFPMTPGIGFTGSVLAAVRAEYLLFRGDTGRAAEVMRTMDQSYIGTIAQQMWMELLSGRQRRAISLASELSRSPAGRGLRDVEVWRCAGLATAYFGLGDADAAIEVLRSVLQVAGGLLPQDIGYFSPDLREFAIEHVEGWPAADSRWTKLATHGHRDAGISLTKREREVIRLLATDLKRDDIAAALFISPNTLKSHLRALFKKIGVSSREAAVLRAHREGWL